MDEWIALVVVVGVGVPLLVLAALLDTRRRRRVDAELAAAPLRGDPGVDSAVPDYITQDAVDAAPRPGGRPGPAPGTAEGVRMAFGHLDPDFASAGSVAQLVDAAVLMVDDDVDTMRELLAPLTRAAAGRPLVIAASSFHPDVLASLKANRRMAHLPVVAVEANTAELLQLQDVVGGQVVSSADLKAGWLPEGTLGRAVSWRSDMTAVHVRGTGPGKG